MEELANEKNARRKFLKWAGSGVALLALGGLFGTVNATELAPKPGKHKRYAMLVDLRRCIGCGSCSIACKQENNVPLGYFRTWVKKVEKGYYSAVRDYYIPTFCNHCEDAICNRNCPVQATYKTPEGLTLIDYDRCIGCRYCLVSCPYTVRFAHPYRKTADKCTFCAHRLKEGLKPACVTTCPPKTLIFGDLNDPESEIARIIATQPIQVLKPEQNTKPHVFYIGLDEMAVAAGKSSFKYMKYYTRDLLKELNLNEKKAEDYYQILDGISNSDRKYDYHLKSNIKGGF